jgi:hypothetical protein
VLLARRWAAITVAAFAGHLAVFGVLLVSLRATGVSGQGDLGGALAAWGSFGSPDGHPARGRRRHRRLGLSTALVGFGAGNAGRCAVLLYRVLTVVPTLVLGGILGLTWRRHRIAPTGE